MKKSRKSIMFCALAVSLLFLSCSQPGSSGNGSNTNNDGATTSTSGDNPGDTPTNPGGGDTPIITPDPDIPVYKWLSIQSESTQKISTDYYTFDNYSTVDNFYIYYNENQQKYSSIVAIDSVTTTGLGTENEETTTTNTISKSLITYSITEDGYCNSTSESFTKNGSEWNQTGLTTSIYEKTTNGYQFNQDTYTINAGEQNLTSTNIITYELISRESDKEIYKCSYSSSPTVYYIYEYEKKIQTKLITYIDDIKRSEITYVKPNNSIILERLPDYTLSITKQYDTDEVLVSEQSTILEDVILDEAQNILTIKIGYSTNTDSNYTYTTTKYKRMQIPFSNE